MHKEMITFNTAKTILFGEHSIKKLPEILNERRAEKILVITDEGLTKSKVMNELTQQIEKFEFTIYDDIEDTPDIKTVRRCGEFAKNGNFDTVIGFGGGSPMDAAKAVAVLMTNDGDIEDFLGKDKVRKPSARLLLISTTAGTGSEVTLYAVLSDKQDEKNILTGIADKHLLPECAIADPMLTVSMSPSLTANTGIDALSHALESYLNIKSNFQTEPLALRSIEFLVRYLEDAVSDGTNREARYHMAAGSVLAGMSLSQTGGGLVHALAETIQVPYRIQHGSAIAVFLPHVMSYNVTARPDKYANAAMAMGLDVDGLSTTEAAKKSVERVSQLLERIGLSTSMSELGIPEKDLEKIARNVFEIAPGLLKVNPRPTKEGDLTDLLRKAY